jgi:dTDP-4-amino-4,6-dideoxy-D-glucose acyltransferase
MFYTKEELKSIGFKSIGDNVLISNKTSIYNAKNISIGNNVRIDDFSVLSAGDGGIDIGNNVHIVIFCSIIGKSKITFSNFSGLSSRVSVYSSTDDYSGGFLTNPTVDEKFTNVISGDVFLGKHVIIGAGSVILPNVTIGDYSAVAGLSLVSKNIGELKIFGGIPAKEIKERKNNLIII